MNNIASIEKRSENTYRIAVSCGYDSNGKKLRKYKTINLPEGLTERQKEKEVQKAAVLFEQEVESGVYLDGNKVTFAEFTQKWLKDYAEKQLAPKTVAGYKDYLKRINVAIGHIKLSKLQPQHLNEFYNNLAEGGVRLDGRYTLNAKYASQIEKKKNVIVSSTGVNARTLNNLLKGNSTNYQIADKLSQSLKMPQEKLFEATVATEGLNPKTILHHHRLISSILNKAVKWQVIISNPAARVEVPKVKKKEAQCYDDEQIMKMFGLLSNEPLKYQSAIYIALYGGLRLGETTGLEWSDVDFKDKILSISKARQYVNGLGSFDKEPKTERSNRKIQLSDGVLAILKEYKKEQAEERLKLGDLWIDSGKIFTQWNGVPMFPQTPSKWFDKWLKKNELPKITFHQLRHSHASILIGNGVDIATVSKRLGHSKISTTIDTYTHAIKSKDEAAAVLLDDIFSGNAGKKITR